MKCKFCDAELEDGVMRCPSCGEDNAEVGTADTFLEAVEAQPPEACEVQAPQVLIAEPEESVADHTDIAEAQPVSAPDAPQKPKAKLWQLILGIAASLVLLAALAIILLYAFGVDLRPRPNDINKKDSYSAVDQKAIKAGDKVVATVNGKELTNAALQIYYKMQVVDFINTNATYLSYMGFDYTAPLSEQTCYYDESLNWEQYFINVAIETWQNYQSIYMISVENGFVPSEALRTSLEDLPASIEQMAVEEGFNSGDAFIQDRFGPTCKLDDYLNYCRVMYVSSEFINITPSVEEVENFYVENEDFFLDNEIGKDSGPMVNVRHILLQPEETAAEGATDATEAAEATEEAQATDATEIAEGTEATEAAEATQGSEESEVTDTEGADFSEEAWADCLKRAEDILAQWKAGDATEESFAELANTYSADGGSNTTGGLYSGITKDTNFVENFLNWSLDESRQVGDTGIVKTEHGYHIMYFAYSQPQWEYYAVTYFLSDRTDKMLAEAKEKWPIEISYKDILLPELVIE